MKLSEGEVSGVVRMDADAAGVLLMRNNVGALKDSKGRLVRYGLCNESEKQNDMYKSSDFIGIKKVKITQDMVGQTIGQFVARETKHSDWTYTGTGREPAQLAFIEMIRAYGGDADFATGPGTFYVDPAAEERPSRLPRSRRRNLILDAACEVMELHNSADISFKDIAVKSGLSYYGVKNYFANRNALLEASLSHAQQIGNAKVIQLICTHLSEK